MSDNAATLLRPLSLGEALDTSLRVYRWVLLPRLRLLVLYCLALMVAAEFIYYTQHGIFTPAPLSVYFLDITQFIRSAWYFGGIPLDLVELSLRTVLLHAFVMLWTLSVLVNWFVPTAAERYLGSVPLAPTGTERGLVRAAVLAPIVLLLLPLFGLSNTVSTQLASLPLLVQGLASGQVDGALLMVLLGFLLPPLLLAFALAALVLPLSFAPHALLLEGQGIGASLRRSVQLARRTYGRLLVCQLIIGVLAGLVVGLPMMALSLLAEPFALSEGFMTLNLIGGLIGSLIQFVLLPLPLVVATLLYYDVRVRHEGFAVEHALWREKHTKAIALFQQAQAARTTKDWTQARLLLDEGVNLLPRDPSLLNLRGVVALEQRDFEAARRDLQAALLAEPGAVDVLYNLACLDALVGDADAALATLTQIIQRNQTRRDMARADADFASLRDDPRFIALVGSTQTASTPQ